MMGNIHVKFKYTAFEVDAQSKASVCGHSLADIAVSNPTRDIDVCILRVLFVV
jgi:hypothetical protein